jgi:hypothetical protein
MSRDEHVAFWGFQNLRRWPVSAVSTLLISSASKTFLTTVGLPFNNDWTLNFELENSTFPRMPSMRAYRIIGYDECVPVCIDETGNGRVMSASLDEIPEAYINASVELFGDCLYVYEDYRRKVGALDEEGALALVGSTEDALRTCDPTAFDSCENWWPQVVAQMREGML